jgi:hypothetical protein
MNDTLVYSLATLGIGFLALVVRYSFKSKCNDVSLCYGLIKIKRDTECETKDLNREESEKDLQLSKI